MTADNTNQLIFSIEATMFPVPNISTFPAPTARITLQHSRATTILRLEMKPILRYTLTAGHCLLALCLTACFAPNVRVTTIGSASAVASLHKAPLLYREVTVSRPTEAGAPVVRLLLPTGEVIDQQTMTVADLMRAGFVEFQRDYRGKYYDRRAGKTFNISTELRGYGATFVFAEGDLVEMRLTPAPELFGTAQIGRKDGDAWYSLPMTQEQLERVFGRPDKVFDKVVW